jgi:Tol biopolymer transport system component
MGFDMEKMKFAARLLLLAGFLSVFVIRCGDSGQMQHFIYRAHAEWSPVSMNSILVTKDEFDVLVGQKSGCSSDVSEPAIPPPVNYDLFLVDTTGKITKRLTADLHLNSGVKLRWSPRGDRIAVFGSPSLAFFTIDTNGVVQRSDTLGYVLDADWSPDGSMLVCSGIRKNSLDTRSRLYFENPANGLALPVGNDSTSTGAVAWSSQNVLAYSYSLNGSSVLVTMDTSTANRRTVDSAGFYYVVHWSPDGKTLLYSSTAGTISDVIAYTAATFAKQTVLHYVDNTFILALRYSPDGTTVSSYTGQSSSYNVYVMNPDGTNQRLAASLSTDASWSPDSKQLVYVYYNAVQRKAVN